MKKLSELHAPVLAGVVKEHSAAAAKAEIQNCIYDGAGMIDLHLPAPESCDVATLKKIIGFSKLPILALNYKSYDWEDESAAEEDRVASLLRAVEAGANGIDMQGYTYHLPSKQGYCGDADYSFTKGNPKEVVTDPEIIAKQSALIERVHAMGAEVLLSCHPGIPMTAEQVVELALFLERRKPDILKIVTVATNEEELAESFRAMVLLKKAVKTPVTYHAAGKAGALSRIVNPILGGHIAFCVDRFRENSVLEQIDLKTAKTIIDHMEKIQ
ncbi:MAG: type I 3-dehydroquinate dehydratase [Clostridia bacterium]|nr:type I 3-dehydroquinate dehydratase [Clostridia bacterium]